MTGSPQVAMWFFWVLFLPGTFLHEISHWVTAKLLVVKTGRFSVWPQVKKRGELQMGSLQVEVADPFRHSLIGLAPLIFGSIAVLLIGLGRLELGQVGEAFSTGDLEVVLDMIARILTVPDVWLWVYLIFAISNAMLPSPSDRQAWWSVFIYLSLALLLAIGLGLNPIVSPSIQTIGLTVITQLLYAFLITIAVDILFILIILIIETSFAWFLGRQVRYNP